MTTATSSPCARRSPATSGPVPGSVITRHTRPPTSTSRTLPHSRSTRRTMSRHSGPPSSISSRSGRVRAGQARSRTTTAAPAGRWRTSVDMIASPVHPVQASVWRLRYIASARRQDVSRLYPQVAPGVVTAAFTAVTMGNQPTKRSVLPPNPRPRRFRTHYPGSPYMVAGQRAGFRIDRHFKRNNRGRTSPH